MCVIPKRATALLLSVETRRPELLAGGAIRESLQGRLSTRISLPFYLIIYLL
jgi:hypothetical protein